MNPRKSTNLDSPPPTADAPAVSEDYFESNKTAGALARDSEREIVSRGDQPLDLRTVPSERWDACLHQELALPPRLLDGFDPGPIPNDLVPALEEAVEKFHGITPPYYAAMSVTLQRTGRAWKYVPEAAPLLTGFTFGREDGDASFRKDT